MSQPFSGICFVWWKRCYWLNGKQDGGRRLKADSFINFNQGFLLKSSFLIKIELNRQAITRLMFGKSLLNDILKFIRKHPDGRCDFCVDSNVEEEEKEDV